MTTMTAGTTPGAAPGAAPSRAPRRDAAANRENLLAAARRVLNVDPDASLDTIAHAAGLSRRSFYAHFSSRETLVVELVERGAERVAAAVAAVHHDDPVVELALLGSVVWDQVEHVRAMSQRAIRGPLMQQVEPALEPLHLRITDAVARAASAGAARPDLSPTVVARLVEGAAYTVLDVANRQPLDGADGRRLVILAGLGALGLGWRDADALITDHSTLLGLDTTVIPAPNQEVHA